MKKRCKGRWEQIFNFLMNYKLCGNFMYDLYLEFVMPNIIDFKALCEECLGVKCMFAMVLKGFNKCPLHI